MKEFPTLYKKTSTGALQFWKIESGEYDNVGWITTTYGQLGTDSPQETTDYIERGKNAGKKNATTPGEQAKAEASAKWTKQLKKGYSGTIVAAEAGEVDKVIEGGVVPMLAHKFADHGHKVIYPAYIQPKLDGIRCIAVLKNGKCTLWSRTRKQITSMPHIVKEIEAMLIQGEAILDGELYNTKFKSNFEHIVHLVRQEEPDPQCTDVEYHIYDWVDDKFDFGQRWRWIETSWNSLHLKTPQWLKLVPTDFIMDESSVNVFFQEYKRLGYEGAMVRNMKGLYVNKRSYDLLKVKEFLDDEFLITDIEEGRGKLSGHVGAFVCETKKGDNFNVKMSGSTEKLKDYFENHNLWRGKKLTVQYQSLTAYNVPRFPVGIRIREE